MFRPHVVIDNINPILLLHFPALHQDRGLLELFVQGVSVIRIAMEGPRTHDAAHRIADERRLPFDVKVPNATTRKAIAELEAGKGKKFANADDLMADLHLNDQGKT
jgi:hypothetical protein